MTWLWVILAGFIGLCIGFGWGKSVGMLEATKNMLTQALAEVASKEAER